MPQVRPKVVLLDYTPDPEQVIALAAKLCYSDADIDTLKKGVESKDVSKFLQRLMIYSHMEWDIIIWKAVLYAAYHAGKRFSLT